MITREPLTARRSREPLDTDANLVAIPQRAVLLFEEQEAAGAVDTALEAGAVEVHEREQCKRLGHGADWMFGEKCRESDRFVAKLSTDRGLGVHREVSLVEHEVEDLVHARNARL